MDSRPPGFWQCNECEVENLVEFAPEYCLHCGKNREGGGGGGGGGLSSRAAIEADAGLTTKSGDARLKDSKGDSDQVKPTPPVTWRCFICGVNNPDDTAPERCPICDGHRDWAPEGDNSFGMGVGGTDFASLQDPEQDLVDTPTPHDESDQGVGKQRTDVWSCPGCARRISGLDKCSVCGATKGMTFNKWSNYRKVVVLLIRWADELDTLETHQEVKDLEAIFNKRFHFRTKVVQIHTKFEPQLQLDQHLYQSLLDHSGPCDLVIVHYTGYGVYLEDTASLEIRPRPSITNIDAHANWNEAERNTQHCIKEDVLVILDTCHPGLPVDTETPASQDVHANEMVYELLSATTMKTTATKRDQSSFTQALVLALTDLANENGNNSFTTSQLLQRISRDTRRKDNSPRLEFRSQNDKRHISLAPLLVEYHTKDVQRIVTVNEKKTQTLPSMSLTTGVQALDGDSGYASASRSATVTDTQSMDPGIPREIRKTNEDIGSVVSDDDDVGSQRSDATTNEERTGKELIRLFLIEQPQFRVLCEKALAKMDNKRFVGNLLRLLKSFHRNLSAEATVEAEKVVAGLLRSHRGRLRISQQLVLHVQQNEEEEPERPRIDLQVAAADKHSVEAWLSHTSERHTLDQIIDPQHYVDQEAGLDLSSSDSDANSEANSERDRFPYITELEDFLRGARSFEILLRDFMLMFLPTELRHVLLSIPKSQIRLSRKPDSSMVNRIQTWIEDVTQVQWNWYPLESSTRKLQEGESRLYWRCTCGVRQWSTISAEHSELVTKTLELSDSEPQMSYWCAIRRKRRQVSEWSIANLWGCSPAPTSVAISSAAQRYTPSGNAHTSPASVTARSNLNPAQQGTASSTTNQCAVSTQNQAQRSTTNIRNKKQSYILFGVQGSRKTLTPSEVFVNDQTTDASVFQRLKTRYRIDRGWLRLWFSIWRLEYCEVVKFNRLALDRMVREHKDLPADVVYEYTPRVGQPEARNPPIGPHLFQTLFYTCPSPCKWPLPHDCLQPPNGDQHLRRIPKRLQCFQNDQTSPICGLETVFAVSFAYVLVYHLLMVAIPFGVFGWWVTTHTGGDLQNASVPVTIALGALSLFWSGAGILTSAGREK
ncbi:hypothetical protein K491DRAFT_761638 [Lophiostoma macrostomum CBS 122681]|uniref:Peptidase C14 caspase domain-containing protein n=1 Tax=Lophiostoma macrostomum CBS 122681 TaxID=1314788 RepID=A0A6A6SVG9_9PLEO|nr:hypothetical protein K491DRAFT_761638 [Lophiostoma macrostomum CBS 122681]